VGPEGASPYRHPGPRGTDTGAGRKERRHTGIQGQEEPILEPEGRSAAIQASRSRKEGAPPRGEI